MPEIVRAQTARPVDEERQRQRQLAELRQRRGEIDRELARLGGGVVTHPMPDPDARTPVRMLAPDADPVELEEFRTGRDETRRRRETAAQIAELQANFRALDKRVDDMLALEVQDRRERDREDREAARERELREQAAADAREEARVKLEIAKGERDQATRAAELELRKTTAVNRAKIILAIIGAASLAGGAIAGLVKLALGANIGG